MHYIEKNLNEGEQIIGILKPTMKLVYVCLFIHVIAFFMLFIILFSFLPKELLIIGLILFLGIEILILIRAYFNRYFIEYCITNQRILSKSGIISLSTEEMNLNSIESIVVEKSFMGKILDYGTIEISGRGTSSIVFIKISNPIEIRKCIQENVAQ